jgi:DNA-binding CsgD family transcriptional regulator
MRPGPDFVDMIEQAACDRNGEEYYRDPLIQEAVHSLSERQRQAMEYTVLYKIPTAKLAKAWGCSERNVRKLRERALHNVREHYTGTLKKKSPVTKEKKGVLHYESKRTVPQRHLGMGEIQPLRV